MATLLHARTLALVTDSELVPDRDELASRVRAAVRGGVDLVQVRVKMLRLQQQVELAVALVEAVGGRARVVVNGSLEAAKLSGADGVHLPESVSGPSVTTARAVLGPGVLIGKSVHSPEAAVAAESEGADYLFFGTVFPSRSHPGGPTSGTAGVSGAATAVSVPVIGIGGINPYNCRSVVAAGAGGVAAIGAIIGAHDSYRAARAMRRALAGGVSHAGHASDAGERLGSARVGGSAG